MHKMAFLLLLLLAPTVHAALPGDINDDGIVNLQDLLAVLQHLGRSKAYDASADLNGDGAVNLFDLVTVSRDWGKTSTGSTLPAGLVLGYSFDDGSATDHSGNDLHGAISGASSVVGRYGGALSFDGVDDFIDISSPAMTDDLSAMTMTMWVRTSGNGYLFSKRDTCSGYWRLDITNGNINWLTFRGGANAQSSTAVAADTWTHIALSWDGTSAASGTRLYINGADVTTPTAANAPQSDASCSLRVGAREGTSAFYDGQIDEVRLYGRALNAAEIAADMTTALGGNYTPLPDTTAPQLSNAQPSGTLAAGTTSTTLRVTTNETATCKYSTTAGQSYANMPNTFTTTASTAHATTVSSLTSGQNYNYYVRCADTSGNANTNDYAVSFAVANPGAVQPAFYDNFESGDLSHTVNGYHWNGAAPTDTSIARSGTNSMRFTYQATDLCSDSSSERRFTMGSDLREVWFEYYVYFPDGTEGVGPRFFHRYPYCSAKSDPNGVSANNKFFAIWATTYNPTDNKVVYEYRPIGAGDSKIYGMWCNDTKACSNWGHPNGTWEPAITDSLRGKWSQVRIQVRLADSKAAANGFTRMWMDGNLVVDMQNLDLAPEAGGNNFLRNGYLMGWSNSGFDQTTNIFVDDFAIYDQDPGWTTPQQPADTVAPVISNGLPIGQLSAGSTSATLRVTTNETATCKYSTTAGQSHTSMPNTFTTTGGSSHSTGIGGLSNGQTYTYYVRCQDAAGNANTNDYAVSFSVASPSGGSGSGECQNYQTNHPEWIFCDDFESGGITGWTYFTPKNQIVTSPVHAGTYAMHIPYDSLNSHDVNRFAQVQISSANADHVFVRGYVYFSSKDQEAIQKKLFYIWSSTQSWDVILNSWKQNGQTDTEPLRLQVQTNCHSFSTMCAPAGVSDALQYDRWYALELEIKANTPSCTAGVNCDGELRVWIDGNLAIQRTGQKIRNDATPVGMVRIGAQADDLSKDFDESRYWDNVVISTQPIGTFP